MVNVLLVGLGNPGYDGTRHNVGFDFLDLVAKNMSLKWSKSKFQADLCNVQINVPRVKVTSTNYVDLFDKIITNSSLDLKFEDSILNCTIFLIKPTTFMNSSGIAVKEFLKYKSISHDIFGNMRILVFHDELDKKLGKIRVMVKKSSHNGLKSLDNSIGMNYYKIGVGIDRPQIGDISNYVLGKFLKNERAIIDNTLINLADKILQIIGILIA
ncbi:aminoacyl-tRNA hydrolase [Candidatus Gromoviella agglomerans]|uniref:aminoacyl-tRNA hydrolase n=1 Tax=Candidatus Gromoviella agglomerans TaxID=2806609 RepID=UPI001E2DD5AC|nr:aminoacyl-tRNA hydrolase [Candidatus Gromoviella agglomerans]UFX98313.1 Peptidyl-tRNA hydrolase [Candidatus Gromoviella agglomerans]